MQRNNSDNDVTVLRSTAKERKKNQVYIHIYGNSIEQEEVLHSPHVRHIAHEKSFVLKSWNAVFFPFPLK